MVGMKRVKKFDFTPLVPESVLRLISSKPINRLKLPMVHSANMGVLFLDITDFTKYTELASSTGHYGIEMITGFLNQYFDLIVGIISKHGGEVVKYGGDSCLAIFGGHEHIARANLLACHKSILNSVRDSGLSKMFSSGFDFQIHGSITYGEVITYIVGKPDVSLNYFMSGSAIKRAYEQDAGTTKGEIAIDDSVLTPAQSVFDQIVESTVAPIKIHKQKAALFVPAIIRNKLADRSSRAELRKAAIIFINISCPNEDDIIAAEDYQSLYKIISRWVIDFDGTINKIDYSDKGYLIIIAFGVPHSHTDLIERAFLCAWRISVQSRTRTDLKLRIGITGCNIYAGIIGSKAHYEYGIIGNGVNIAARLMYSAGYGEIILSESVVERIRNRFKVSFIKETTVKGIRDNIMMYRLVGELPENWFALQQNYANYPILAREKTISSIKSMLVSHHHKITLVVGASGFGKSYLVFQIGQKWVDAKKEIFYYAGDQITNKRRLEFFFQLIRRYLGIDNFHQDFDKLAEWSHTMNLQVDIELLTKWLIGKHDTGTGTHSASDLQYEQSVFQETLVMVCYNIMKKLELVIIENLEFLDPESLNLISTLLPMLHNNGNRIILTCFRHVFHDVLDKHDPFIAELLPFSISETANIAGFFLPNIAKNAAKLIYELTSGNPLFIRELCLVLQGLLSDKNDLLTEATLQELEHRHLLPESLESLFIRTYDNLPENTKTVIKLSAILTKSFTANELKRYLPKPLHSKLENIMDELLSCRLLSVKTIDPQTEYVFPNNIVREAIYRTILLGEKKQLHNAIAQTLIETLGDRVNEHLETIAEHFIKAQEDKLITIWALQAGQKLLGLADYESSIYYLKKALESAPDEETKTLINLMLLEAYVFQGKTAEAKTQLELLSHLEKHWQPLSDRFFWLYSRYLNCMSDFGTAFQKIEAWLSKVKDGNYHYLIMLDKMHCLLVLETKDEFEAQALKFYNELQLSKETAFQNRLAAILGQFYLEQSNYLKAGEFYRLRLDYALKQHDFLGQRIALTSMGIISSRLGEKKTALKLYGKALEIAERLGDRNGYSKILLDMGALYRNEQNYNLAMECYLKSLNLAEITQNRLQKATLLYDIGELHYYLGELHVALDYFKKSMAISVEIGDEVGITFCNDARGDILFKLERYDEAEATYQKNLKIQMKLKDKEGMGHTVGNLGNIAKKKENFPLAAEFYHKQLEYLLEVGDKDGMGRAWFNLAMLEIEQQQFADALEPLHKAMQLFQECNATFYIEITQSQLDEVQQKLQPEHS